MPEAGRPPNSSCDVPTWPLLAAGVSFRWSRVRVATPFGAATFGTLRPRRLVAELGRWDGTHALWELRSGSGLSEGQFEEVFAALEEIGAILDAGAAWRYARRYAENPGMPMAETSPDRAYRLPRWSPGGRPEALRAIQSPSRVAELAAARSSVQLEGRIDVSPQRAEREAYEACMATSDPESKPIASAGDLRPIHLFLLGAPEETGLRPLLSFCDDGSAGLGRVDAEDLNQAFVHDDGLAAALGGGASVVVIAADPSRETAKYGDRGWQYCGFEAGAYAHHLSLTLAEVDCGHRIVGGFYERRLSGLIPADSSLETLLTIVVTGSSSR